MHRNHYRPGANLRENAGDSVLQTDVICHSDGMKTCTDALIMTAVASITVHEKAIKGDIRVILGAAVR